MAAEADRVSNKQQREIPEAVLCSENDSGSGTCHHQRQAEPDDVYTPPQPHDLVRPAHRGRPIPAVPPAHGRAGLDAARPAWSPGLPRDGILPAVPGRGAGGLLRAPCATTTPIRY